MSEAGLLVVEANPGRGKSVLAKSILGRFQKDNTKTVCYFSSASAITRPRPLQHFARTASAVRQTAGHIENLGNLIETKNETFITDFEALWTIFDPAVKMCRQDTICILDALDECENKDAKALLRRLKLLAEGASRDALRHADHHAAEGVIHSELPLWPACSMIDIEKDSREAPIAQHGHQRGYRPTVRRVCPRTRCQHPGRKAAKASRIS